MGSEWLVASSEFILFLRVTRYPLPATIGLADPVAGCGLLVTGKDMTKVAGGRLRVASNYCRRKLAASAPIDFDRSLYSARRGSAAFAMM